MRLIETYRGGILPGTFCEFINDVVAQMGLVPKKNTRINKPGRVFYYKEGGDSWAEENCQITSINYTLHSGEG